jgi:HD-GYP domain-containing protein (c-di-GMP phosphodiesterase class II)
MPYVQTSLLQSGVRLQEAVRTPLGRVLMIKGTMVQEREIEILNAFLVTTVNIENNEIASAILAAEAEAAAAAQKTSVQQLNHTDAATVDTPFSREYKNMLDLVKRTFIMAEAGFPLPMMELRIGLESLFEYIDGYSVLTYESKLWDIQNAIFHKSVLVSATSYLLAKWQELPRMEWIQVALGALLHDIGNVKIEYDILMKPRKLTAKETEKLKKHTIIGYEMLRKEPGLSEGAKMCALQHHEREDGSGYPLGLKSEQIHFYAKIVAIADIYHAMTTDNFHKAAVSPYVVLEQLYRESFGKVDPSLVQTFIYKVTQFHNSVKVKLSDGRRGEIVFTDRAEPTRPWVKVDGVIVNLANDRHLFIEDVISG